MQIESFDIDGVKLFIPSIFVDRRGWFQESYRAEWLEDLGLSTTFVQDNHVLSTGRSVARGLHFQFPRPQAKLIRVIEGAILDVAVDIRRSSPTFGQHVAVELSEQNKKQLYVPRGFAHGYVTLSDRVQVLYKVDAYYNSKSDKGLLWNDPALAIDWRLSGAPVLSDKDAEWPRLCELNTPF